MKALTQRNADQLDQCADKFVAQYRAFLALYEGDKHAQSFVKEIKVPSIGMIAFFSRTDGFAGNVCQI